MGSLKDLRVIIDKRDEKIAELKKLIDEKDVEIAELRSQLDKYQSIFPFHGSKKKYLDGRRKERAQGISAEPQDFKTIQDLYEFSQQKFPEFDKNESAKTLIRESILKNDFMRNLDNGQIQEMVGCMYPVQYPGGSTIIREGDAGSVLYVLEEGTVEVCKDGKSLSRMNAGKLFGELAVLYNCRRTASITALTECKLFAIERQCFQTIMVRIGLRKQAEYTSFLKSVPAFQKLPEENIIKLSDSLEEKTYRRGDYIIRQGSWGNTFYIISKGTVDVTVREANSVSETFVRCLTAGQYFAESAVHGEHVHSFSVMATAPSINGCVTSHDDVIADTDDVTCLLIDHASLRQFTTQLNTGVTVAPPSGQAGTMSSDLSVSDEFEAVQLRDLQVVATLGVGGFGRVELVRLNSDASRSFALKQMKKAQIVATRQQQHILSEKEIMHEAQCHFIVKLYKTFKDAKFLYMLMEPCLGGELWTLLRDRGCFDDASTRFYTACVIQAFEYLHSRAIIYRDLKPENLLLDSRGYVKLVDFGFAKKLTLGRKTWTFCGTPEYVAPEVILNRGHDLSADYWSLGVLMFELLTGTPPFSGLDPMKTYQLILRGINAVEFGRQMSRSSVSLVRKLCRDAPAERLGCQRAGIADIRKHTWFDGFNWDGLNSLTLTAPFCPHISSQLDCSNFDNYPSDDEKTPPDDFTGWDQNF